MLILRHRFIRFHHSEGTNIANVTNSEGFFLETSIDIYGDRTITTSHLVICQPR